MEYNSGCNRASNFNCAPGRFGIKSTIRNDNRTEWSPIYKAQYENAILVYLRGTPIWRPENSVNIWNLLWLSRLLIISTGNTSLYINSFNNVLTSKRAQNHQVSIYFSTNSIVALCHAPT